MNLKYQISTFIPLSVIVVGLLGYNFMSAQWTGAPANPPANNVSAPINTSANYQAKLGDLGAVQIRAGEYCSASSASCMTILNTGPFATWTLGGSLTVNGTSTARSFMYNSDARLKHNIAVIENPIALVEQLRGVTFDWNKDNSSTYGLIAQEVELVLPELVAIGTDGNKSVAYGNIVPILIEAVKVQQEAIKAQQEEIEILKSKLQ